MIIWLRILIDVIEKFIKTYLILALILIILILIYYEIIWLHSLFVNGIFTSTPLVL